MKTRRVVRTNDGNYNTVWFGAKDVYTDEDGKKRTLFYNENDKHDNYAEGVEGVQSSLIQRLSIIRGELWYQVNYGLPLLDKIKNKSVMDASILEIITNHPQVKSVSSYISTVSQSDHKYHFTCKIISIFSNEELTLEDTYSL